MKQERRMGGRRGGRRGGGEQEGEVRVWVLAEGALMILGIIGQ